MASLADAYDARAVRGRRLAGGVGLFLVGAALLFAGIAVATTDLAMAWGLDVFEARELAGVLAGIGLPAIFLGMFAVLPTGRSVRAAAIVGTAVSILGVALFSWAYPNRWVGGPGPNLTLPVAAVYLVGALTAALCLFWAVATFRARNAPGGTVELEVTDAGARVVSVSRGLRDRIGGTGFLGGSTASGGSPSFAGRAVGDGGATAGAEIIDERTPAEKRRDGPGADPYCGNCSQFQYVRVDGEITPYCGLDETLMEDMDPCEEWTPNTD